MTIKIKRIYDPAERGDGFRVLVDRIWPRGVSRDEAQVDLWLKEVAPSTVLRKRFHHDPARWDDFRRRYFEELEMLGAELDPIMEHASRGTVTLLYAARDEVHNNAEALKEYLEAHARV